MLVLSLLVRPPPVVVSPVLSLVTLPLLLDRLIMILLVRPALVPLLFLTFLWTPPMAELRDPLSPGRPPGLKTTRIMMRTTTSLGVSSLNTQILIT